jgi:hypothetical protein
MDEREQELRAALGADVRSGENPAARDRDR